MATKSQIEKFNFVKEINSVFCNFGVGGVKSVEYELWYNTKHDFYSEMIVVTYNGDAIAVRNNTANSLAATYNTIGKLLYGGYYDEVNEYNSRKDSPEWIKEDLESGGAS